MVENAVPELIEAMQVDLSLYKGVVLDRVASMRQIDFFRYFWRYFFNISSNYLASMRVNEPCMVPTSAPVS